MSTARLRPPRALWRVLIAILAGASASAAWSSHPLPFVLLIGWNAASVVLLALSWLFIVASDATATQRRAGSEDPGRTLVYVIVVVASAASLFSALLLSRRADTLAPSESRAVVVGVCLATVALAWALTHTTFTLRYARLYYREDSEGVGGVEFPGDHPPSYADFAYFAFTVGMCFQVSDACVTSSQIRRAVLLQALIAFIYNTVVLAFVLNLVFGAAQ
jgi:uncharacterized membrane protein